MENKTFFIGCAISVIIFTASVIGLHTYGYRINTTNSLPELIWKTVEGPIEKNRYVLFCPPNNTYFQMAKDKGYLSAGNCDGNLAPMIKKVMAVPGDLVQINDNVQVNGQEILNTPLLSHDSRGASLESITINGIVPEGHFFVLSDQHTHSFDSRYFGDISEQQIISVIEAVNFF